MLLDEPDIEFNLMKPEFEASVQLRIDFVCFVRHFSFNKTIYCVKHVNGASVNAKRHISLVSKETLWVCLLKKNVLISTKCVPYIKADVYDNTLCSR